MQESLLLASLRVVFRAQLLTTTKTYQLMNEESTGYQLWLEYSMKTRTLDKRIFLFTMSPLD